tara:strand:+ start:760 stop:957 length:198 start_codon:yes stop_codon:yes gene_type:complete
MDTVAVVALIISIIGALGHFIRDTHIQKCKGCCIESDCRERSKSSSSMTPPDTPKESPAINSTGC